MSIKTFLLEPTEEYEFYLRRFTCSPPSERGKPCPGAPTWGHDASSPVLWRGPASSAPKLSALDGHEHQPVSGDVWPHDDPRRPLRCERCEYAFQPEDEWQLNAECLWKRSDTGGLVWLRNAPVGAVYRATWFEDRTPAPGASLCAWCGSDGSAYICVVPGPHPWHIDARARNCDSPCRICGVAYHAHKVTGWEPGGHHYEDAKPDHRCWVRHGTAPDFHVDKNGLTCGAGAGSIAAPKWHGFLHHGHLIG